MRLTKIVRLRLRSLFTRAKLEQELDEELQYHVERQIAEDVAAGMTREEARYAALRSLEGLEQRKEECRDMRRLNLIDNLLRDFRYAIRQLRKNAVFTSTAVVMLALGMCASVAIFAFVDAALLKPLPYKDPRRLASVFESIHMFPQSSLSYLDYLDWKKRNTVLDSLDIYNRGGFLLSTPTGTQPVRASRVSDGFFRTLGVAPFLGRDFYAGEDLPSAPRAVILSYATWQKRYGGKNDVLGKTVILDHAPSVIIGVLPRGFHFAPAGPAEFWSAFHAESECDLRRSCHDLNGVGRLKDGVSIETALANLKAIAQQLQQQYPGSNLGQGAAMAPLREVITGDIRPILLVLLGGGGLLLLIANVNVAGLLLVRSESRKREIAVRTALGASSGRLIGQFVTEAVVLIAAGSALGLVSAHWVMQLLAKLIPEDVAANMPFLNDLGLNVRVAAFAGAISLLTAALFSFAPSLRIWSSDVREDLTEGGRGSAGTVWRRLGSKLVVLELSTAMVLLVSAGLLGKSLYRMLQVDVGLQPDHLATIEVLAPKSSYETDAKAIALARVIVSRIESMPGVKSAGIVTNGLPLDGNGNTTWFRLQGRPYHGEHEETPERDVSPGYFTTLGATLLQGRYFTEAEDASKPRVAIINRAFARQYFHGEDPVGKHLADLASPPVLTEIVGIVEDIREGPLDAAIPPVLYLPFNQNTDHYFGVVARTSQAERPLLAELSATIRQIDPDVVPLRGMTMTDRIHDSPSAYIHRSSAWLVGGFAALAWVVGLVGLYGVVAYSVSQRTREIGVRMALGAQPGSVYQLILREAGRLAAAGIVIGLLCSVGAATMMRGLLFGVQSWDGPTLCGVAAALGISALLASYIPARRAASVNPVDALRAE
jgi:macrolide transport system ATP-binding/permease protein